MLSNLILSISCLVSKLFDLVLMLYELTFIVFVFFVSLLALVSLSLRLLSRLNNKEVKRHGYVLVTGCDSGFGLDVALRLSKENMYTFAGCLTPEGVRHLNSHPSFKGLAVLMDVTNTKHIDTVRNIIEERVKDEGLWCVINNAGIWKPGPIEWLSVETMKETMDVNLWGAVHVIKAMLPLLKRCRDGARIVNMSSIAGRVSDAHSSSYSMSKFALEGFSDSLRHEMRPWNISVHIIEPGHHATDLFLDYENSWKELWEIQPDDIRDGYGEDFHKEVVVATRKIMAAFKSNIGHVTDAYIHATLSRCPRPRYVVGNDALTAGLTVATLPTEIADFIINVLFPTIIPAACRKSKHD